MKSGNLNFLEPFGPHQAPNGTALPLPIYMSNKTDYFLFMTEREVPERIRCNL